ncbi:uncharacterized protein LY89DRAFT_713851 [Mollisia scopiformis]|uniref:Uncharacterized protein n=1 Tax=Mollisia scopiformis TaxID=149040 RepID=A0A194XTK2_MOLSC|nr:uncharacterized protein LY89DRAFT_713851 [Mollisia scopiformis]KUJ23374.1 hypothetical protein LY89DRAFT_713851 [Mollisia scopiformis]
MGSGRQDKGKGGKESDREKKARHNLNAAVSRAAKREPGYQGASAAEKKRILGRVRVRLAGQSSNNKHSNSSSNRGAGAPAANAFGLLVGGGGVGVVGGAVPPHQLGGWMGRGGGEEMAGEEEGVEAEEEEEEEELVARLAEFVVGGGDHNPTLVALVGTYPPELDHATILADIDRRVREFMEEET